jgi:hypothetical protein
MECASAKATDKTGTSAADSGTSAADTGTSAATAAGMGGAAAAAAAMSTAASTAVAASTSTAAAATGQFYLLGERGLFAVFLVERVKRRQAAVEDFLLTEKDFMRLRGRPYSRCFAS